MCSRIQDMYITDRGERALAAIAKIEVTLGQLEQRDAILMAIMEAVVKAMIKVTENANFDFRSESESEI